MRSIFLILAIVLGTIFEQASSLAFMIQWLLAAMLFFSFLNLKISAKLLSAEHLKVSIGTLVFGTLVFYALKPFNESVAISASIIALAPTAIAAPVMANLLKTNVAWVALSTLVTNAVVAALLPFYIPLVYGIDNHVSTITLLQSLLIIFIAPFSLALVIQNYATKLLNFLNGFKNAGFILFMSNIFLASAKSSHFLQFETQESLSVILMISFFSALVCLSSFSIGRFLGRNDKAIETSLAFGQKNTMFSVWIALTYINPLVSLAPMSYVLFQNSYLSYLLYKNKKQMKR